VGLTALPVSAGGKGGEHGAQAIVVAGDVVAVSSVRGHLAEPAHKRLTQGGGAGGFAGSARSLLSALRCGPCGGADSVAKAHGGGWDAALDAANRSARRCSVSVIGPPSQLDAARKPLGIASHLAE